MIKTSADDTIFSLGSLVQMHYHLFLGTSPLRGVPLSKGHSKQTFIWYFYFAKNGGEDLHANLKFILAQP